MDKHDLSLTVEDVLETISDPVVRDMTGSIACLFSENGLTVKVKRGYGDVYRLFCHIRKSRETAIVNPVGKNFGPFEVQVRVENPQTLQQLDLLSDRIRKGILGAKDCKAPYCCNCGSAYRFTHQGVAYRKCHMLCDNFTLRGLQPEDRESLLLLMQSEIEYARRPRKKPGVPDDGGCP